MPRTGEGFLRKVLDASLNGLYVHDLKAGVNTFINARYTELTGYTLEQLNELDRDAFIERFHPEDRPRVFAHLTELQAADDEQRIEIEYRFRRRDGVWIWCLSSDSVFERDPDGSVRSILGTFIDISTRKRAEAKQRASEAEVRRHLEEIELIYHNAPVGLCVLDRELRYLRINERLAEINGRAAAEYLGRTVRAMIPDLADELEPRLRRVLDTGEPVVDIEIKGMTAARPGVRRTWMESWLPLRDTGGEIIGISVVAREITQERQARDELAARETRLRAILDNAAVGIAQVDLDGRFLRVNERLCQITGYPREELTGLRFHDITHPDDLGIDLDSAQRLAAGEIADYSMEKRYVRKDGSLVWVKLTGSAARRPDGTTDYFIAIVDDISAHRAAEAQAQTLATVVETSGDFIGIAHLDGRAMYLNRAGRQLVGLEDEEAVRATRVEDYLFPEDLPFVRDTVIPTVLNEGRWVGEFRFRHFLSGEPLDVHWDVVRIDDPDSGRPARLATVTGDIRAQKRTEAALREANRRKDEFLAVMGHELRNPMAPICNAVDVLKLLKIGDDPRIDRTLDILDRQTRHMSRLLDDLLDISRIIRDKLRLERRPVEIGEIVAHAADGVRPLIDERHHRLDLRVPAGAPWVDGDPVRLGQILLNLLLNAANYTPEGGRIDLIVEADDSEVVVRVRDNGPGIPPQRLDDLFSPFQQGERSDGPTPSGLGLGLTISRRLAELHGGRLEAESDWPQPGSEFRLHLPRLAPTPEAATTADSVPAHDRQADIPILVVDDNPDVARSLTLLLELIGYPVQTALSGEQALALADRHPPRVALVDIGLPDINGLELAGRLREHHPNPARLSLIALTGYGHDEARERSLAAGFDDHLAKPIDRQTLEALLDRVV